MRKVLFFIILSAAVLLSACGQAAAPTVGASQPGANATNPTAAPIATRDPNLKEMVCQVISTNPTEGQGSTSRFPAASDQDHTLGTAKNPAMTLIEYSDFECPYCAQFAPILEEFQAKHPDDVKVIFRYFPLPSHSLGIPAANAAEAAGLQGKFWEMHNLLFSKQGDWASMTADQFNEWLMQQAPSINGLDKNRFATDIKSPSVIDKVKQAQQFGLDSQIPGTPFLLKNGKIYQGARDLESLEAVLQLDKLKDKQFTYCPPMQIDASKQYTAKLKTEKGDVLIQLFPDKAPLTVDSFVFLARQGWFNNITFHRVIPGFIAQTGDPSATGFGNPGYAFEDEISDLKYDKEGVVGMANSGPGLNGSQFFITYKADPQLDGKYTIFGQVIQGMDVLKNLTPRDPSQSLGLPAGDKILSVEIQEK